MRDRVSTKILDNGATRYGVYDETGKLLRYEYIKLEDEPSTEGDFFNKANMLPDHIPALLGLKMGNPQVADALNVLANVGNLHVWERVQDGVTDYLTSTDRNAYPDQSLEGGQDAYYVLGDVDTSGYYLGPKYVYRSVPASTSLSVSENGTVELNNPTDIVIDEVTIDSVQVLAGKFIRWPMYADGQIVFIPTDAQAVGVDSSNIKFDKYQPVTGHAAIPANTTITYLGQLGGGARIEVGSYVGTGTYGSSNPNSLYVGTNCVKVEIRAIYSSNRIGSPFLELHPQAATETWRDLACFRDGSLDSNSRMRIVDGVLYWHSNGATAQGNENGVQHTYSIFKK